MSAIIHSSPIQKHQNKLTNRLILIGNGFDIAHGHKTEFNNFILNYLATSLNTFVREKNKYEDELMFFNFKNSNHYLTPQHVVEPHNVIETIEKLKTQFGFQMKFKSKFSEFLLSPILKKKWVNIEAIYFEALLYEMKSSKKEYWKDSIGILNNQLRFVETSLISYLQKIQELNDKNFDTEPLIKCFTEHFLSNDISTLNLKEDIKAQNLLFLNFNYTNFLDAYVTDIKNSINTQVINIHGKIGEECLNPIIFGFGDEHDKEYLEFEEQKNNILFEHIKSFKYLQTDNYYKLLRFLESNYFQVHIYGHSCGVTDRTMLNHIFEHDNCKSIKIFYHQKDDGTNNYTDKTFEISRHFNNKGIMRKKVVPFNLSVPMPQPVEVPRIGKNK